MGIYEEITLDGVIEEVISWLEETRRKCQPGGSWWDATHNQPEIGGIYVKVEYDFEKLCWILDDSGVYDVGHACYSKSKHKYTFRFKGIEWIDGELKKEVIRQYKEFLVYAKKYELEKDFEDVTRTA